MEEKLKLYTPEEIAELLRCTPRCVYNYLRQGKMPGRKLGGRWLVLEDDLHAYLRGFNNLEEIQDKPAPVQATGKRVSALGICADIEGLSTEKFLNDKRAEVELEETKLRRVTGAA